MTEEIVRQRTDVLLSSLTGGKPALEDYVSNLQVVKSNMDAATLAVASSPPPYSMRDLDKPMKPSTMVIPESMSEFLSGHTKVSTSYAGDWPLAEKDNRFGEHHPFHPQSNCCPLLHGAAHGEPEYTKHVMRFTGELMNAHREAERRIRVDLKEQRLVMGDPSDTMLDLYNIDRGRYGEFSDEEYIQNKTEELNYDYGLLSYLFGLEYQTTTQRDEFMDLLGRLSNAEEGSPDADFAANQIKEKSGLSWDRALRNWRDRFTPLAAWWARPADKSGPTRPHSDQTSFDRHHSSPWVMTEEGITQSHNYHWWEPFQYWGGVGRDFNSLRQLFNQSYSNVFNGSWLESLLFEGLVIDGKHSIAGSHFPKSANTEVGSGELSSILSSHSEGDLDFERKRALWTSASNHHHLHPSEIEGQGSIMEIPHDAYMLSPFGMTMMNIGEHGTPFLGSQHPNSNEKYHQLHNRFSLLSSNAITREAMRLSQRAMKELGSEIITGPIDDEPGFTDVEGNTLARGNIQQFLAAANYNLMRQGDVAGHSPMALPNLESGQLESLEETLGAVSPESHGVVAPIFNTGNNDAWGHPMPTNIAWTFNPDTSDIEISQTEEPFIILQRTAHEGHVKQLDPAFSLKTIMTKDKDINLLTSNYQNYPSLIADLHKSDDYEPTGVFNKNLISPAHTVKAFDDLTELKGFSGDWVIQTKPLGSRMLIEKKGKTIEPRLPNNIQKDLKGMKGDFTIDGYLNDKKLSVVDLLVHKGSDLSFEPLSDRINVLRTLYHSTDNIHFPAPSNCVFSDDEGLVKSIAGFDKGEFLVRDSYSTFIKDKELHPKWVLFVNDDISKTKIYPPLPELLVKGTDIILEYPEIISPVIVKTNTDENGIFVESYEGLSYLVKQAQSQFDLWSAPAALVLKEGAAAGVGGGGEGTGMVSSTTEGTLQAIHSVNPRRKKKKKIIQKAPAILEPNGEEDEIAHMMRHVSKIITEEEISLTSDQLEEKIDGLKEDHLLRFGNEYGIERTEDNKWTVNQAVDDDIADTPIEKFAFPRMNRASSDGGAWSGMQGDITAPTGATTIDDEENTTFGDPKEGRDDDQEKGNIPLLNIFPDEELEKPQIEMNENGAVMRFPKKEKKEKIAEAAAQPSVRTDSV